MDCSQCGATLPGKSDRCRYCGFLNDVDLRKIHHFTTNEPDHQRACPHCEISLTTVNLQLTEKFLVERCEQCFGIFFDPNEIEAVIDHSVSHVNEVDYSKLGVLLEERSAIANQAVKYIKCPVCEKLMNRRSFGARSGVIIDSCKEHGVWLDGGELKRILMWAKAGGKIHCAARKEERRREAERQAELVKQQLQMETARVSGNSDLVEILSAIVRQVLPGL